MTNERGDAPGSAAGATDPQPPELKPAPPVADCITDNHNPPAVAPLLVPADTSPLDGDRRVRSPSRLLYRGAFYHLGLNVVRYRYAFIIIWAVLLVFGAMGAWRVGSVLQAEQGNVPHSQSAQVNQFLATRFAENLYAETIAVTYDSSNLTIHDPSYRRFVEQTRKFLAGHPLVSRVIGSSDWEHDPQFVSPDGKRTFVAATLTSSDLERSKVLVIALRNMLKGPDRPPGVVAYVTGNPAINLDVLEGSLEEGSRAEKRAIPLALLILLVAFGAPVAAALPIATGIVSFIISLALLYVLGHFVSILVYAENLITMLGLGIGIDYSLLLVTRFREELRAGHSPEAAVVKSVATAGRSIVYSGIPVAIGLSTLLIPDLPTMRSIGMGAVTVVLVTVLAAITLLPAVLAIIGRGIDAPRFISHYVNWVTMDSFWYRWAQAIMSRPWRYLIGALIFLLALTWPLIYIQLQSPNIEMMPDKMESKKGVQVLQSMSAEGYYSPLEVIVRTRVGSPIWDPQFLTGIHKLSRTLGNDQRVSRVISLMDLDPRLTLVDYLGTYANPLIQTRIVQPELTNALVTTDDSATLLHVFQSKDNNYTSLNNLVKEVRAYYSTELANAEILVGGIAANNSDFDERLFGRFPLIICLVLLLTYLTLLFFFRSVLLPLTAIFMNLLSVGASYGLLVVVFQYGYGGWLLGLENLNGAIMNTTPVLLFCLIFGLSMDYEVFLMSRIREEYERTGRNREAAARGLEKTAGIITSAALIMIAVFMAFTFAEILLVKEIGFALAAAIIIDATIVRIVLAPALMRLLGRWNWWLPEWLGRLIPKMSITH